MEGLGRKPRGPQHWAVAYDGWLKIITPRRWHGKCHTYPINPPSAMPAIEPSHELEELEALFANPSACRDSCHTVTNQAIQLAAYGHAQTVLEIVQRTPEKALFMPLTEGIRLHLGMVISSTGAARSLALFIAGRIRQEAGHGYGAPSHV